MRTKRVHFSLAPYGDLAAMSVVGKVTRAPSCWKYAGASQNLLDDIPVPATLPPHRRTSSRVSFIVVSEHIVTRTDPMLPSHDHDHGLQLMSKLFRMSAFSVGCSVQANLGG